MSMESMSWLANNVLVGNTAERGEAWHITSGVDSQGRPNHFDGPIPHERVTELIDVPLVSGTVSVTIIGDDGVTTVQAPDRQGIVRADTGDVLGIHSARYEIHGYREWLYDTLNNLADGGLNLESAGLLRRGARAWVQATLPDHLEIAGDTLRPFIVAASSCDGSIASQWRLGMTRVVCDNTLASSLGESLPALKVRHTSKSLAKVSNIKAALGLLHKAADEMSMEADALMNTSVSDAQWQAFLDAHVGEHQEGETKNRATIIDRDRDALTLLWTKDERVSPWNGTAWGVVQAVNTHAHHVQHVRGATRQERNFEAMVMGSRDSLDNGTLQTLNRVLTAA